MAKKTKPDKETLHRLYWDEHMSLRKLGQRFGVDGATIRNWMIAYSIPRRDLSPGKKRSEHHGRAISEAQKRLVAEGKRRYDGEHSPAWKGGPVTVPCGWCSEPVEIPRAYAETVERTFCKGTDCRSKWQSVESSQRRYDKPHYGGKDVACDHCGKTFRRDNSALKGKKHHFCSRACAHAYFLEQGIYSSSFQSGNYQRPKPRLQCEHCGRMFYRTKRRSRPTQRCFCSPKCKKEFLRGDKIYNFKGGYEPYYGKNWRTQRRKARKRDDYTCQHCGVHQSELNRALDVHHIVSFSEFGIERYKEANRLENLISLCGSCHSKTTTNSLAG